MTFRMRWPTQFGVLTQAFRARPEIYQKFGFPGHEGLDFQAPRGSEIYAVAAGAVSEVRLDGNSDPANKAYGNQLRVQHTDGYLTIYAHLLDVCVAVGQQVQAGQLLGRADNTGNSDGDHLHLTLKLQGASAAGTTDYPYDIIDPTPFLDPFSGGGGVQPTPPVDATLQVQVVSPELGKLNVRSAPYIGAELVTQADDGVLLGALEPAALVRSKVGQYGQWLWIRTGGGQVGYVAAWYVRLLDGPLPDTSPMLPVYVNSPDTPLKLRAGAGTQYAIVTQLPHGALLTTLENPAAVRLKVGQYGEWLQVCTASALEGYTAAWYVQLTPTVAPAGALMAAPPGVARAAQPLWEERRLVKPDNLTLIHGLGPKAAAFLASVRIMTFEQLAALSPTQLRALFTEAGLYSQYVATWPEQAQLCSAGRLDELATLRAQLNQGRAR